MQFLTKSDNADLHFHKDLITFGCNLVCNDNLGNYLRQIL
jgi:hypothetical protein